MEPYDIHDIEYNPMYAFFPGADPVVALFLSFLKMEVAEYGNGSSVDVTSDHIMRFTGLSYSQQARCTKVLSGLGMIERSMVGMPPRSRYTVDHMAVYNGCEAAMKERYPDEL